MRFRLACSPFIIWFIAAGLPQGTRAAQVIATVTGIVYGGTDQTGVFGFAPNTSLASQTATIIFIFEDTKGAATDDGYRTSIAGIGSSSPGSAIVKVGGGSYVFPVSTYSEAYRTGVSIYSSAGFGVYANDEFNSSLASALIEPSDNVPLTPDANWASPFSRKDNLTGPVSFRISNGSQFAWGEIFPTGMTVTSPDSCSNISMPGGGPLLKITDPINSVPSSMPGSAICPQTESSLLACPSAFSNWRRADKRDEWYFHNPNFPAGPAFHVYKEQQPAQQWGAECAYYPDTTERLVPIDVPGHGTANYWPDWTPQHFYLDPGGPRLGQIEYYLYWAPPRPRPPGMQ